MSEFVPKRKTHTPRWIKILLAFSIILLIGAGFGYWWLHDQADQQRQQMQSIQTEINGVMTPEKEKLKERLSNYKVQLNNFSQLLNNHKQVSAFLDYFDSIIHPQVVFSNLDVNVEQARVSLGATAEDYRAVGGQLLKLYQEEKINKVDLGGIKKGEAGVDFSLNLEMAPEIFNYSSSNE